MAKAKKPTIYVAELDRFGYTLISAGLTEEEAVESISKEYIKTYKEWNHSDPRKEIDPWTSGSFYDSAMGDISIHELEPGCVEWT